MYSSNNLFNFVSGGRNRPGMLEEDQLQRDPLAAPQ